MEELQAFYDKLERHDWFYHYSDNGRTYSAGQTAERRLSSVGGAEFENLFKQYKDYIFSSPMYGNNKKPKPERPGGPKLKVDIGEF